MLDRAVKSGSLRRCPRCQLTGNKDENCAHMVCERCRYPWCYFCGRREDEGEDQSLSAHNEEWESNVNRSPMYLGNIYTIDSRWPRTDRESLQFFHRCRTRCELYELQNNLDAKMFYELTDTLNIIDATGFTIADIEDKGNRILIRHPPSNDNY